MGRAGDRLAGDAARDSGKIDGRGLLGEIELEAQRDVGGARRRLEAEQGERGAGIPADHGALAGEREPARLERPLPHKGDLDRRRLERGLTGDFGIRHAGELDDQPALASCGRDNAFERKIGEQQDEEGLRLLADDLAVDVDLRRTGLGGVAERARHERDIGASRLAAKLDGGIGQLAFARRHQADMHVHRRERRQMHRPADAFGQAEQVGDDAQAIGVGGLQAEVDPARGLVVQTLDAALAVQRQRARCGEVELLHVERAALQREARIELAGGNVGKQKLADA